MITKILELMISMGINNPSVKKYHPLKEDSIWETIELYDGEELLLSFTTKLDEEFTMELIKQLC
jgi:hypothetical protein